MRRHGIVVPIEDEDGTGAEDGRHGFSLQRVDAYVKKSLPIFARQRAARPQLLECFR